MKNRLRKSPLVLAAVLCFSVLLFGCNSSSNSTSSSAAAGASAGSVAAGTASGSEDLLSQVKQRGVLVVGSSNDAPFAFVDVQTQKFSGIDAEIVTEIAKRLGIPKVEMKQIPFENLLVELNNKKVDMVTDGLFVKAERQKIINFTNVWYQEKAAIVVSASSSIDSTDALKDKVVGAQKGTAFLETVNDWKSQGKIKDVKIFTSQAELLMAVKAGKIDACITDGIVVAYTLTKDKTMPLKFFSPGKESTKIAAAVRKSDTSFLQSVNEQLDAMKADGTIQKILAKYGMGDDYFVSTKDGVITPQ